MRATRIIAATAVLLGTMALGVHNAAAAADTLVVKSADGSYGPGAATSWKTEGATGTTTVTFELAGGVDGAEIAKLLSDRLASARIAFAGGALTVSGIPEVALLDQLSALSLSGESDPLAELGGLGGAVIAMDTPEGGGSIRASKPSGASAKPRIIKEHDQKERLEAEVVSVKRGAFPLVTLKLKIRRNALAGPLKSKLRRGKVVEAQVVFATTATDIGGGIDLRQPVNQANLVAWYLERGDRVNVHPIVGSGDTIEIDWIARKPK
ncbi:MAG: hypothetical protein V3T05_13700 [Myxococcota bacterium]